MTLGYLPTEISLKNGIVLKRNVEKSYREAKAFALANKKHFRTIYVLNPRLKGKTSFFGTEYKPSKWIFVEE